MKLAEWLFGRKTPAVEAMARTLDGSIEARALAAVRTEPRLIPLRQRASTGHRRYNFGGADRLMGDVLAAPTAANADIHRGLKVMKAYSRHLAQNNDYAKAFMRIVRRNVIGPLGIRLQSAVLQPDGTKDKGANRLIEAGWVKWSKKGRCTVDGGLSLVEAANLFLETIIRDGEVLIRHTRGRRSGEFGYQFQFISPDLLDDDLNVGFDGAYAATGFGSVSKADGTEIRMGVERDRAGKPVAYHLLTSDPGDEYYAAAWRKYVRVPASEIQHVFIRDWIGQARGVPWLHTAGRRLILLGGYEEAEVVAARAAASKMGYKLTTDPDAEKGDETADDGNAIEHAEAGTIEVLGPNVTDIKTVDWQHPNSAAGQFMKVFLRGAASGLGVSYNSLANDLEGVNYSSIRQGVLDDRDEWRGLQQFLIDSFYEPIFEQWLGMALTMGALGGLPASKFDKFNSPAWQPRGFQWIDPVKDIEADERAVALRTRTRTQICADRGVDFEDVVDELAAEEEYIKAAGLDVMPVAAVAAPGKPDESKEEKADDDDE